MKKFVVALACVVAGSAFAQDKSHHVISIGTEGFGWSGAGNVFKWDKDESGVKDHTSSQGALKLNYNYVFDSGLMIGGQIDSETSKSEIKRTDDTKTESESSDTSLGLSVGFNFNDDISRSWWVMGTIGSGKSEEEVKDEDGKTNFDYDYTFFTLSAGKRISLESWGLKNVSYNPSISFTSATAGGDAEDDGLESLSQFALEIIKVDIVF